MHCQVCSKSSTQRCSKCNNVSYCSKECQKKDWKTHKPECYPVRIEISDKLGSYLVATRDIQPWELILKESPLLCGPVEKESDKFVCFGCYGRVEEFKKCSKCKAPICSPACEKLSTHADFECKIFAKQFVDIWSNPWIYHHIFVLRGLLLKEVDQKKWDRLLTFRSKPKTDEMSEYFTSWITSAYGCIEFVRNTCGLTQYKEEEIRQVMGIAALNEFSSTNPESTASCIYPMASKITHSCTPNGFDVIDDKHNFELRACVEIKAGTSITMSYADIWKNTRGRQLELSVESFLNCSCQRCEDPTELGTYFSGINCSTINPGSSCSGFLLPIKKAKNWNSECMTCKKEIGFEVVEKFTSEFQNLIDNISEEEKSITNLLHLIQIAKEYEGKVHPNFNVLVELEYKICLYIHEILPPSARPEESIEQKKMIAKTIVKNCQHLLDLNGVINPGLNRRRGELLYCQQLAMTHELSTRQEDEDDVSMGELLHDQKKIRRVREEASKILSGCYGKDVLAMMIAMNQTNMMELMFHQQFSKDWPEEAGEF